MNLILLFDDDFVDAGVVRLHGRRLTHVTNVLRAGEGDNLTVGVANGRIGQGVVTRLDAEAVEMRVNLDRDPPSSLAITLVLAVPRPKVLNRVLAGATSLGIKRIALVNAWRVEKSYWRSPRMTPDNLQLQAVLGLEQARDTVLPTITLHRLFRPFVENELPSLAAGTLALVPHPGAAVECPRAIDGPVTVAIGPEAGFIPEEIASLERVGFTAVSLGERVLRVETAVSMVIGRLV
jgi:16S rRNA (uracil1498-N3)-methyltransferase